MTEKQKIEFFKRLEGKEGCNFRKTKKHGIVWTCGGGNEKSFAKKILTAMKITGRTQEEFLELCDKHGGYCDCEILFNAGKAILK